MATRIGLQLIDFPFSSADAFWRWIDLCEQGGVDSVWQADRLVGAGDSLECLSVMAALAGRTRRLKFGMSVLALGWREPLVVAKTCATIDYLSNGRLLPAFGVGALQAAEWAALGLDPRGSGKRVDAALTTIADLWRGEAVNGAQISPLPVQARIPLWIGGSSPAAIRRTAQFGTGWLGGLETPEAAGEALAAIKAALVAAGRSIDLDHYGGGFFYRFGAPDDALRPPIGGRSGLVVGGADEILARVRAYEAVGVTKLVLRPLAQGDDDALGQTARLIEEVLPRV